MRSTKARPTRDEQKEATALAVLDAARAEFDEFGFDGANLRSIAARAGVSAGTVVHHYGDKRGLLYAALFDDLETTLDAAAAAAQASSPALSGQLSSLAAAVFAYYEKRPRLSRTLLKESLFAEGPWQTRFTDQTKKSHAAVRGLVEDAKARGEVGADVNADVVAGAFLAFFYFALIGFTQGALVKPQGLFDALLSQHLRSTR